MAPDQSSHLDALIGGIVVLLNMMPQGYAYVGVHLNSGGCIHALKNLIRKDYKEFCQQFGTAMTDDGRRLQDAMKGQSYQEKLDMAWELYAVEKLAEGGFTEKFQRVYFELEEFEMFLGSMAVFHFGARYPCFCGQEPIPLDWWHLRLHLYIGSRLVRVEEAVADGKKFLHEAAKEEWTILLPSTPSTSSTHRPSGGDCWLPVGSLPNEVRIVIQFCEGLWADCTDSAQSAAVLGHGSR